MCVDSIVFFFFFDLVFYIEIFTKQKKMSRSYPRLESTAGEWLFCICLGLVGCMAALCDGVASCFRWRKPSAESYYGAPVDATKDE